MAGTSTAMFASERAWICRSSKSVGPRLCPKDQPQQPPNTRDELRLVLCKDLPPFAVAALDYCSLRFLPHWSLVLLWLAAPKHLRGGGSLVLCHWRFTWRRYVSRKRILKIARVIS